MLLLTYFGFDENNSPYIKFANENGRLEDRKIVFRDDLSLKFDVSERYCVGGHDFVANENLTCPNRAVIDKRYSQCRECMKKTAFNPAFYYSDRVSTTQLEYNKEPHMLYLAYFGDELIKVGISNHRRKIKRLLEQGARAAMILGEFSSANIARQYEEKIARMDGIIETLQVARKIEVLDEETFDFDVAEKRLLEVESRIEKELRVEFENHDVINCDTYYGDTGGLRDLYDMSETAMISGKIRACIGSLLVMENWGSLLVLPLKKFVGYRMELSSVAERIELAPKQVGLF